MSSVFELAKSTLAKALGPSGPNLPFSIGDPLANQDYDSIWRLHRGTKKVLECYAPGTTSADEGNSRTMEPPSLFLSLTRTNGATNSSSLAMPSKEPELYDIHTFSSLLRVSRCVLHKEFFEIF
jgi:hypothetical protein